MTYRQRREARAERLRAWAAAREERATAQLNSQPELRHDWAFITQPGRIPERDRMNRADARAFESLGKAERMAARADEIERQAARAIYSDDPDAPERLREKLAKLEAERDRWTAYNKACRKAGRATAEALAMLDDAQRADLASLARVASWQLRANGAAPAYLTSNLGGNISRLRERLERLERPAAPSVRAYRPGRGDVCRGCGEPLALHAPARPARIHGRIVDARECPPPFVAPGAPPAVPAGYEADPARYACPDGPYCADPECVAFATAGGAR